VKDSQMELAIIHQSVKLQFSPYYSVTNSIWNVPELGIC